MVVSPSIAPDPHLLGRLAAPSNSDSSSSPLQFRRHDPPGLLRVALLPFLPRNDSPCPAGHLAQQFLSNSIPSPAARPPAAPLPSAETNAREFVSPIEPRRVGPQTTSSRRPGWLSVSRSPGESDCSSDTRHAPAIRFSAALAQGLQERARSESSLKMGSRRSPRFISWPRDIAL